MMRHTTLPLPALTTLLALGLLTGPSIPARAARPSVAAPLSTGLPSAVPPVVTLPMAQMEDEHEHSEGFQSDADPKRNLVAPVLMVLVGLMYLGFVRWKMRRQRTRSLSR